jgi:hypothetical protein
MQKAREAANAAAAQKLKGRKLLRRDTSQSSIGVSPSRRGSPGRPMTIQDMSMTRSQKELSKIDSGIRNQLGSTQEHLRSQETLHIN